MALQQKFSFEMIHGPDIKIKGRQHACIAFLLILLSSCQYTSSPQLPPITKNTIQFADTLPIVHLPEGADPESADWKGVDLEPRAPVQPLSVAEQQKLFLLPKGYQIEAVLTNPLIQQPGAISFDGNGRMYVLELRTYMLNADSDGTLEPNSVISRWEDRDNDGVYESGTHFVDNLVFPRFVLPYGPNSVLTMESNQDVVYQYTDTDGDGKADMKEFFTDNFGRSGNVEHQQAFLYWGMDNWLYSTINPFRIRQTDKGVIRESTGSNKAQWGITHDDQGTLWFQGGANGVPTIFQFPIHYGDYLFEDEFEEGFMVPWGAPVKIADMQGGMDEVRQPDGSLNRVTGAAGNDVYRGHRWPEAMKGQYFYGEPVARIVRQVNPIKKEGLITLQNVYQDQQSEFLRTPDPLFRPVDMATAPDGSMYIVDMYHGIIQEGQWTPKGSYLRTKIEQYQLDKVISLGRIWRITHQDYGRDKKQPRMYGETSQELVQHFHHPNGWWRDMAQQILVQRRDRSVIPALTTMAESGSSRLARIHALWTLEGIGGLTPELVLRLMNDPDPGIRIHGMWTSESLYKTSYPSLGDQYLKMIGDPDLEVSLRAMMTAKLFKIKGTGKIVADMLERDSSARGLRVIGRQILDPPIVNHYFGRNNYYTEAEEAVLKKGAAIYDELCATCHGPTGLGTPVGPGELMAPALVGSDRVQAHPDYGINVMLHGLRGPIKRESYAGGIMVPMAQHDDEWIAAVLSFIRSQFENNASIILPEQVASVRAATASRKDSYTFGELMALIPQEIPCRESWKVTASHSVPTRKGGTGAPESAFSLEGFTTGGQQRKGMWVEIDLAKAYTLNQIEFYSPPKSRGHWRENIPPFPTTPLAFELSASLDGVNWELINVYERDKNPVVLKFTDVRARYLKLHLTKEEKNDAPWNMRSLKIFGKPAAKPM